MIEIRDISKSYTTGDLVQRALDKVSITFRESEFVAVLGPSGSGKTTFLNILGGFDHADSGDIVVNGVSTHDYGDAEWDAYRNHRVGFIFQSYNLIPHQTVLANVELALTLAGVDRAERRERARAALERVGLGDHINKRPAQLSGGQMQRVAIARALVNDPEIVLADEPTGALDTETGIQVMNILAEIAQERLVIMVTHNPQLAEDYASRIVRIKDGRIVGDTQPVTEEELAAARQVDEDASTQPKRASMSLLTALALSFNNLMTKKGRTIMTAFAGSIGIIGIASILALSNGVNDYIAKVEQDTLSSYPLTIARQSYDLTSMLTDSAGGMSGEEGTGEATADQAQDKASDSSSEAPAATDKIPVFTMLSDMFATVRSNDMKSFKTYLDDHANELADHATAIQYDYGIMPVVYRVDDEGEAVKLSPNSMSDAMSGGASSGAMAGTMMTGGTTAFNEMIDNPELLDEQYDVVAGRWATEPDECVLVLSKRGKISDFTLYSIGVLDPADLDQMVDRTMSGAGEVEVPEVDVDFTYEDALGTEFKVLAASDAYRKNEETGGWTDMSDDAEFMNAQVANGIDLKIVGVVKPSPTAKSAALTQGIAYTSGLTSELMERSADSAIVQQQLAHPETDVFTGKSFDTLQEEAKHGVDLSSLFSVDEAGIKSAFKFDENALGAGLDLSGFDFAGLDLGGVNIDLSGVMDSIDVDSLVAGAPTPDFSGILDDLEQGDLLTPEQLDHTVRAVVEYQQGFLVYLTTHGGGISPSDPDYSAKLVAALQEYNKTPEAQAQLSIIAKNAGEPVAERVQQKMQDYVQNDLSAYMQQVFATLLDQVGDKIAAEVSSQLQSALAVSMGQLGTQMAQQLAVNMQNALSVDGAAFASAIHFNMDADDLSSLMTSYANASRLTYDNNLMTLGYADEADPQAVSIYPVDFEAKETVLQVIDTYNAEVTDAGEEDKAIVYTDYMGVLMGSVTDIVNMISLVLIAFVSISLVVSSIMIGIITYISVLERKKEIGILRAMGASKRNIANVFNAETFIEGLIAGVLAIAVVVLVSFPVNAWVLADYDVESVMHLPVSSALGLIVISVVLTVVAGLIPSRSAARRDPVEALRSE
ncbi:ABC transporter ATP-binding protein/permease [Collinsella provencensis]|uniref:ABC transporter ATP-binding protein/permease n=1 Tax=Collinsella provencensis TaxID=1937461 RepID=UPI000C864759|nr:ABC transporter ATP-binding protein/permease [Collinsella provencensis]